MIKKYLFFNVKIHKEKHKKAIINYCIKKRSYIYIYISEISSLSSNEVKLFEINN